MRKIIGDITGTFTVCAIVVFSAFVAQADDELRAESKQAITNFKNADSTLATYFANCACGLRALKGLIIAINNFKSLINSRMLFRKIFHQVTQSLHAAQWHCVIHRYS
jgi:hypothetical protein